LIDLPLDPDEFRLERAGPRSRLSENCMVGDSSRAPTRAMSSHSFR
jgi:hypothetical protein